MKSTLRPRFWVSQGTPDIVLGALRGTLKILVLSAVVRVDESGPC